MPLRRPIFWLQPVASTEASRSAPSTPFGAPRCTAPRLAGDRAALGKVLQALRHVGDHEFGHNIVDDQHITALTLNEDEVELSLSFAPACGLHQQLAEAAFQALRRMLPGRDIYVTHPR